ncbi:MAG: hypothetical protein ABEL04_14235 [Salinibacter sp.]|uniref:hypothetical protein n=1 Tax=Salinibacter sp. TaxID=2065818 RepID=UPI0035D4854A
MAGVLWLCLTSPAVGQGGHGPAFGLATPTLPQGGWNYNATLMSVETGERGLMTRQSLWYGLTEHLQLNASVPVVLRSGPSVPTTRGGTMMGGLSSMEVSAYWRFHRQYLGVGKRFESTLLVGGLYPIRNYSEGRRSGPGVHLAAVTGYASRSVYGWAGGGYQHYVPSEGARPGDLRYGSLVIGWRPGYFRRPSTPDWRLFAEALGESVGPERREGVAVSGTGGEKVFVGPTTLGLYGAWGLSAGALFPLYQDVPPTREEGPRLMLNFTYWF